MDQNPFIEQIMKTFPFNKQRVFSRWTTAALNKQANINCIPFQN